MNFRYLHLLLLPLLLLLLLLLVLLLLLNAIIQAIIVSGPAPAGTNVPAPLRNKGYRSLFSADLVYATIRFIVISLLLLLYSLSAVNCVLNADMTA